MALAKDRDTQRRDGALLSDPVAAAAKIYTGALVALNAAGDAVPATAAVAQKTRGVAQALADNTAGIAGAVKVATRRGVFNFKNAAADLVVRADIGKSCYVVDDETVAKTDSVGTRPVAGVIRDVDATGVWVEI